MISLNKFIGGSWEQARNGLREDLETIETTLNQRWQAVFGNTNVIKASAIPSGVINTIIAASPATYSAGAQAALRYFFGGI